MSSNPQEVLQSPVMEALTSIIKKQLEQQQQLKQQEQEINGNDNSSSSIGSCSGGFMCGSPSLNGSSNIHPALGVAVDLLTQLSSQADGRAHVALQLPLAELVR